MSSSLKVDIPVKQDKMRFLLTLLEEQMNNQSKQHDIECSSPYNELLRMMKKTGVLSQLGAKATTKI